MLTHVCCVQTLCGELLDVRQGHSARLLTDGRWRRADCEHPIAIRMLKLPSRGKHPVPTLDSW